MATLLHADSLGLAFGSRRVFEGLTLTLDEGERVGLIGVNGSGKSSLMKMLARALPPDEGDLQLRRGARVTYLPQEPEFPPGATVATELTVPDPELRAALAQHAVLSAEASPQALDRAAKLADTIERLGGWNTEHRARELLERLGVTAWEQPVEELSGGTRKRVAIARALLTAPDLLLLDEPTNHLDADTVDWLEEALDASSGALLLVTHDRYFLDDLVDRIVEITPGAGVRSYPGNYEAYLVQKLEEEEESALAEHKRQRWIAQEVAWLRRGVEARRTKSKARIQRAKKLMAERGFAPPRTAGLALAQAPRLGQIVIEAKGLKKRFGERPLVDDVDFVLQRGERVGLVGPNGVGKTTFLRLLLGELPPDAGSVAMGPRTQLAYYDQARAQLNPEDTVYEAAGAEERVQVGGKDMLLRDYLEELLFPVPMQRQKVAALSGGERNRLFLARLFLQGANLLVLDEPTNDLDLVTLNVLERLLLGFSGSVLLVTHDRYFLDKVATAILSFEGNGRIVRHAGNFETYRTLRAQTERARAAAATPKPSEAKPMAGAAPRPKRLGYKEQRELDGMEAALEAAEGRKAAAEAALADPKSYSEAPARIPELRAALTSATAEVERLYARWQELQDLKAKG
ncbi:MAG: ABC-F family ATP-binding cassette domain-containing protein [Deltaproteobacteria bacterium]